MDHEISSSQLGGGLEGWDWTCMQLDDGTEIKAYRLRTGEGESDPWSAVYWIDGEGRTEQRVRGRVFLGSGTFMDQSQCRIRISNERKSYRRASS